MFRTTALLLTLLLVGCSAPAAEEDDLDLADAAFIQTRTQLRGYDPELLTELCKDYNSRSAEMMAELAEGLSEANRDDLVSGATRAYDEVCA